MGINNQDSGPQNASDSGSESSASEQWDALHPSGLEEEDSSLRKRHQCLLLRGGKDTRIRQKVYPRLS